MSGEFSGRLDQRVTLSRRAPDRDALGGASGRWSVLATFWAAIAPDGSGDLVAGDALSAAPRWRVTLRTPCGAVIDDRIGWGDRALRIRARLDDPASPDRIILICEEERA